MIDYLLSLIPDLSAMLPFFLGGVALFVVIVLSGGESNVLFYLWGGAAFGVGILGFFAGRGTHDLTLTGFALLIATVALGFATLLDRLDRHHAQLQRQLKERWEWEDRPRTIFDAMEGYK